jgi:hypothetical protein
MRLIALFALTVAASGAVGAQAASGVVQGVVADTSGAPLQAVTVRIVGTETRQMSDARGRFRFDRMTPGRYQLRASLIAALPAIDSVLVRAGDTTRIRFALRRIAFVNETLPPRYTRGTRPDTAPAEKETFDLVARVGRIPLLRARPPQGGQREIRLWLGGGIAIPETLIRLTINGERVQGEVIRYVVETLPDRDVSPSWRASMDTMPDWLRHNFGCGELATDTLHYSGAQAGYQKQLVAVCTARYSHEPDWRGLLRELESHHVWTLPDGSELPTLANVVVNDGGSVTVEAWNGRSYHTYEYGDSEPLMTPESQHATMIHRALIAFLTRLHYDLHPRSQ